MDMIVFPEYSTQGIMYDKDEFCNRSVNAGARNGRVFKSV